MPYAARRFRQTQLGRRVSPRKPQSLARRLRHPIDDGRLRTYRLARPDIGHRVAAGTTAVNDGRSVIELSRGAKCATFCCASMRMTRGWRNCWPDHIHTRLCFNKSSFFGSPSISPYCGWLDGHKKSETAISEFKTPRSRRIRRSSDAAQSSAGCLSLRFSATIWAVSGRSEPIPTARPRVARGPCACSGTPLGPPHVGRVDYRRPWTEETPCDDAHSPHCWSSRAVVPVASQPSRRRPRRETRPEARSSVARQAHPTPSVATVPPSRPARQTSPVRAPNRHSVQSWERVYVHPTGPIFARLYSVQGNAAEVR